MKHLFPDSARLAVLLVIGLAMLIPAQSAISQVTIVPLMQEISVNRGGKAKFELRIRNRADRRINLALYVHDLDVSEEGVPTSVLSKSPTSCQDWLTLQPQSFALDPDSTQIVKGILSPPKDAMGGYYAFLTCDIGGANEPIKLGESEQDRVDLEIAHSVSSTLLVTVKSSENTVELKPDTLVLSSGVTRSDNLLGGSGVTRTDRWQVVIPVENLGNVHAKAEGFISVWSTDAKLVDKAPLRAGKGYILPHKKRIFRADGNKPLADGEYMIKVQMRPDARSNRMTEGTFAYSVVNGVATAGAATEDMKKLLSASAIPFTLSSNLLDFDITPSGTRTQGLTLSNRSNDTLTVSARLATWAIDDSAKIVLNPDSVHAIKPCTSWVDVWPNPIMIGPKRTGTAKITVQAPADIDGEYFAAVVFETPNTPKSLPSELELPRAVLIPVASTKNVNAKADVAVVGYKEVSPMMRTFVVTVANKGNVHCAADGSLTIFDSKWNTVLDRATFGGVRDFVLPQTSRAYVVALPGSLEPGKYSAVVELKYHEKLPATSTEYFFNSEMR